MMRDVHSTKTVFHTTVSATAKAASASRMYYVAYGNFRLPLSLWPLPTPHRYQRKVEECFESYYNFKGNRENKVQLNRNFNTNVSLIPSYTDYDYYSYLCNCHRQMSEICWMLHFRIPLLVPTILVSLSAILHFNAIPVSLHYKCTY